ncbi:hypothetical protein MMC07_009554, partial [Pseudocyphellaria aurata]|nr:hypothetical protein [Pseudocyphellaria aurata]
KFRIVDDDDINLETVQGMYRLNSFLFGVTVVRLCCQQHPMDIIWSNHRRFSAHVAALPLMLTEQVTENMPEFKMSKSIHLETRHRTLQLDEWRVDSSNGISFVMGGSNDMDCETVKALL